MCSCYCQGLDLPAHLTHGMLDVAGMASRPGQDWVADEVFGVHPLNGTEILTMQDSEAPNVAVLARWQQEGDIRQAVHLQAGQVSLCPSPSQMSLRP